MTEEEKKAKKKECDRRYYERHKEEKKKHKQEWNKKNKEKVKEQKRRWYVRHREEIKGKRKEYYKKRREETRFYNSRSIINIFSEYHKKGFARFISILGYFTILKIPNESSRRSIMTRLGKGTIDEQEAIRLSGQVLTQEDINLINSYIS